MKKRNYIVNPTPEPNATNSAKLFADILKDTESTLTWGTTVCAAMSVAVEYASDHCFCRCKFADGSTLTIE